MNNFNLKLFFEFLVKSSFMPRLDSISFEIPSFEIKYTFSNGLFSNGLLLNLFTGVRNSNG